MLPHQRPRFSSAHAMAALETLTPRVGVKPSTPLPCLKALPGPASACPSSVHHVTPDSMRFMPPGKSSAERSARLAMNACATGNTHTCERTLDHDAFIRLKQRAAALRVAPTWLSAAAWMRAIHQWNVSRGETANTQVSLEFPVSLRRGRNNDRNASPYLRGIARDAEYVANRIAQSREERKLDRKRSVVG
jgi:hypothetical protein